jgi:MYXO-CTERM domain-containing protein
VTSRGGTLAAIIASQLLLVGCIAEGELVVGGRVASIIGGEVDTGHLNVVILRTGGSLCTGTLVAPHVVLTAAHCIDPASNGGVIFGSGVDDPDAVTVPVISAIRHRRYDPSTLDEGLPFDIAMLRLAEPAPEGVEPMAMNLEPLPADFAGSTMLAIGFGASDGEEQTGFGVKRSVVVPVNTVEDRFITYGNNSLNTCQGDSGGPGVVVTGGVEHVVGITSTGLKGCVGSSRQTRLDAYRDDFVIPVLDAWDGPCQFDGRCVTEGCRTPDPDCDICGFDSVCASDCPEVDLDCPLTGLAGDACSDNFDCEGRICDPAAGVCVQACDIQNAQCGLAASCKDTGEGVFACRPVLDGGGCGCAVGERGSRGNQVTLFLLAGVLGFAVRRGASGRFS